MGKNTNRQNNPHFKSEESNVPIILLVISTALYFFRMVSLTGTGTQVVFRKTNLKNITIVKKLRQQPTHYYPDSHDFHFTLLTTY